MGSLWDSDLNDRIYQSGIIAVLVLDDARDAVPLARSLLEGGISAVELTLRTPAALDAMHEMITKMPEILCGAGTVLTIEQINQIVDAGAAFAVSPGLNANVIKAAQKANLPFAPGIVTPSDIEASLELGCKVLKFFPAEASGGMKYLTSMAAPYLHLGLQFIPLGGLDLTNMESYLRSQIIPAIGGSWIAPRQLIKHKNWKQITANARQASDIVHTLRSEENK